MHALHIVVSGRVQGVMFRDFTRRTARSLHIVGTVTNKTDGTVEVVAEGGDAALHAFVEKLKKGPTFARVDNVSEKAMEPTNVFKEFSIVYD